MELTVNKNDAIARVATRKNYISRCNSMPKNFNKTFIFHQSTRNHEQLYLFAQLPKYNYRIIFWLNKNFQFLFFVFTSTGLIYQLKIRQPEE